MNDPIASPPADEAESQERDLGRRFVELLRERDVTALEHFVTAQHAHELARAVAMLDEEERAELLELLPPEMAADLLERLPSVQAVQCIEDADPEVAAAVIHELPSDLQADVVGELEEDEAAAVLEHLEREEAERVRRLSAYSDEEAGGLMITEVLKYPADWTVGQVVDDFLSNSQLYRDYQVQYTYVCDEQGRLIGVLRLRDLLLSDRNTPLRQIMIPDPIAVSHHMTLDELYEFFQEHSFLGVPVVDDNGVLLGVVQRGDVDLAWLERADRSMLKRQGIMSGEEIRSMPLMDRVRGRLSWLSINIVLNLMAASVISYFEDTLAKVIALAAFLPIISDMSGCSGNQAVAVSIRELTLGLIKPTDVLRVWLKEISVGCLNGLVVGLLLGLVAVLWRGNPMLGVVVGVALMLNTMIAVSIGGLVPLLLRRFGKDPAMASGPLLTTVTDMCGFFIVLSLATMVIDYLQ
ncbi:MAG: magnesium transporter MgtE [Pirellulaceae bacterium]|nr:MAG: magnesium transporter MgtE [Pirellulaceae bacterium]